jgi:phosphohistidine swiveling domain-containing protein
LHKIYKKIDCIVTYKNTVKKFYISKKERKKLSDFGLWILEKDMPAFEKQARFFMDKAGDTFQDVEKKDLSVFTNKDLAKDFKAFMLFVQRLWKLFFYTEYFMHDKVQEKAGLGNSKKLTESIKKMGDLKLLIRSEINKTIFGKNNLIDKYLNEINKRTNISDFSDYSHNEIANFLSNKKDRKTFVLGKFNNWQDVLGEEAENIIKCLENEYMKEEAILNGSIGNKGYYKGKVKIVPFDIKANLDEEINKMEKGDVLVSGSTGPEMILACKKAGAIITDEGGILSHAAVISRELNIPSVIGTKIATEILKDGDLVEVDADKGIVRKV